jgi:hypothetical protein
MDMKQLSAYQQQILDLWMKGHSGLRIAQMLGTSRSAVLGMLKRIREWGHSTERTVPAQPKARKGDKPAEPIVPKPRVERKAPPNLVRLAAPKRPSPPPKPVEPAKPDEPKLIRFPNLKPHHCRYVMNNGHPSTFLFCGKDKWKSSFCEEHYKLVYVPAPLRKR